MVMLVKRCQVDPGLDDLESLVAGRRETFDQMPENGDMAAPETPPLRREPILEKRAAVNFQPVQKITDKQLGQVRKPLWIERLDPRLQRRRDCPGIDPAIGKIKGDRIARCHDPAVLRFVKNAAQLAETPAQLAARVVRDIPQQLAEPAAADRMR